MNVKNVPTLKPKLTLLIFGRTKLTLFKSSTQLSLNFSLRVPLLYPSSHFPLSFFPTECLHPHHLNTLSSPAPTNHTVLQAPTIATSILLAIFISVGGPGHPLAPSKFTSD